MTYSQRNEEALIREHFGEFVGTCLDLGANDGSTYSNTLACIERGWNGVMVECSPSVLPALNELHAQRIEAGQVQVIPYAVAHVAGELVLQDSGPHVGATDKALLSTLSASEAQRWKDAGTGYAEQVVKALTWPEILDLCKWKTFDLISIDIEAMDFWVLQQMDLTALGCRMLIIEDNLGHQSHFEGYCAGHGMKLWTRNPENLLFVR